MEDIRVCAAPECEEEFEPSAINQKYCSEQCKKDVKNRRRRKSLILDLAEVMAPHYEEDSSKEIIDHLRAENRRLNTAVDKYKKAHLNVFDAFYQAAEKYFSAIDIAPSKAPKLAAKNGDPEVAVAHLADFQMGKVTRTFNTEILADRIEQYAEKVVQMTEIQRSDHPVDDLHIRVLGDIVEGEQIFGSQSHVTETSLYAQVGRDGPQILSNFINTMLANFERIHFVGVIGNHGAIGGRARRDYNPETNMDRLLYRILQLMYRNEPRITWDIPDGNGERSFYAIDTIGNYSTLLVHGDQFPSPTSSYAYLRKILSWKTGGIPDSFEDACLGHWHHNIKMTLGNTVVRIVGSPESSNTFTQELMGVMARPSQHLQFVNPRKGIVTWESDIWLD